MYIPSTFFSSQGACIEISATSISGSGGFLSGSFVSQSISWSYIQFETFDYTNTAYPSYTASLNILSGSTGQAKVLIVAGGGTGGGEAKTFFAPIEYLTQFSGGGGAGGVVYYDNFPLSPGTYEIGVAGAQVALNGASGSKGFDSYIKLPNNIIYTPFNTSYLIAEGGGAGGTLGYNSVYNDYYSLGPGDGGSAGGAGSAINTAAQGGFGAFNPNGGLNGQVQGYRGGLASGVNASTGGGGAGGAAPDGRYTVGGDGVTYNVNGTPTIYSKGGGGASLSAGLTIGGGGRAGTNSLPATSGYGGIVIIAWPICLYTSSISPFNPIPTFPGIEYLVLGGGGGGGGQVASSLTQDASWFAGGGGGAGAFITGSMTLSTGTTYPIVIGQGGAGAPGNGTFAQSGQSTTAFGLTAIGGGAGGGGNMSGSNGGSGGGAGGGFNQIVSGGIGTIGQGYDGATNISGSGVGTIFFGGGGGGASAKGNSSTGSGAGNGGSGSAWLDGIIYAGGGGAGSYAAGGQTLGGSGIGGRGQTTTSVLATTGSANKGSGGGGGRYNFGSFNNTSGASGSAGIVVIRYAGTTAQATGGTISISGSCVYHTFTGSANLIT
jgi:hypothetical protein